MSPLIEPVLSRTAMEDAALRWRERSAQREARLRLVRQGRYIEAEGIERLLARMAYQGFDSASLSELTDEGFISLQRETLAADFLERAQRSSKAVGRVVVSSRHGVTKVGTGFMISPKLMLTTSDVLPSAEAAEGAMFELGLPHALQPERYFYANHELGFTAVAIEGASSHWCKLAEQEIATAIGHPVNLVHYPLGKEKEVIVRNTEVVDLLSEAVQYRGVTAPGSSGAPVFNDEWKVIAIQRTGIPRTDLRGNYMRRSSGIWEPGDDPADLDWIANEGIAAWTILSRLRGAENHDLFAEMFEPIVVTEEVEEEPPIVETPAPAPPPPAPANTGTTIRLNIPLKITVEIDGTIGSL
ncbi:trypsin-like serine peptidase [Fimbriimonas ginsengisoli]|uniref:Serine protease n=1 Tax=Fimbriimonas ginsengisoli Gsoil 348 TaxID=661478 RepID=A0A068NLL8_FIMGI|nr:serine protease [Fimbriimonas ginsengisoli]AIE83645.1 V8-like protein Glu-specific endopeptidase-like protein [Fimbriimonas ginsengisoli Gsoil 348]